MPLEQPGDIPNDDNAHGLPNAENVHTQGHAPEHHEVLDAFGSSEGDETGESPADNAAGRAVTGEVIDLRYLPGDSDGAVPVTVVGDKEPEETRNKPTPERLEAVLSCMRMLEEKDVNPLVAAKALASHLETLDSITRYEFVTAMGLRDSARKQEIELLKRQHSAEEVKSQTDYLTGALNREGFQAAADEMFAYYEQHRTEEQLLVFSIDLIGFKLVNDLKGHAAGDEVLRQAVHEGSGAMQYVNEAFAIQNMLAPEELDAITSNIRSENSQEEIPVAEERRINMVTEARLPEPAQGSSTPESPTEPPREAVARIGGDEFAIAVIVKGKEAQAAHDAIYARLQNTRIAKDGHEVGFRVGSASTIAQHFHSAKELIHHANAMTDKIKRQENEAILTNPDFDNQARTAVMIHWWCQAIGVRSPFSGSDDLIDQAAERLGLTKEQDTSGQ